MQVLREDSPMRRSQVHGLGGSRAAMSLHFLQDHPARVGKRQCGHDRHSSSGCYPELMPNRMALTAMSRMIRDRRLSPVELVDAHLSQVERENPRVNAFIDIYDREAREQAARAESEVRGGGPLGPLHGLPVTIKDSFDLAGRPTRSGTLLRRYEVASADSTAAERLKAAGAIILGKTSTPEFLYYYETDNHYIGRTCNPWNPEWTSGGSSGGEAAAIASFCSAGGVGSDGGGSIREPAHFCGIAGLKPTPGRCPAHGHWPEITHPTGFMGVGGPMARSVADVRALFEVLAGHDPRDPFSAPAPLRFPGSTPSRVAVLRASKARPAQARCVEALNRAAVLLADLGCEVVEFDESLLQGAHELWSFFFIEARASFMRSVIQGRESDTHWTGTELIASVQRQTPVPLDEFWDKLVQRDRMRSAFVQALRQQTVILAPGFGVAAFPHRRRRFVADGGEISLLDAVRTVSFVNLLGLPSLALPVLPGGEQPPAGVQLVGAPYSEELLLDLGVKMEEARGPLPAPPGTHNQ
jgi:Asp-tRNA(Asn)/Glu-tRNA(Gln) amidotransferase A subunit family amidase